MLNIHMYVFYIVTRTQAHIFAHVFFFKKVYFQNRLCAVFPESECISYLTHLHFHFKFDFKSPKKAY